MIECVEANLIEIGNLHLGPIAVSCSGGERFSLKIVGV
jgi:hypothetical protein